MRGIGAKKMLTRKIFMYLMMFIVAILAIGLFVFLYIAITKVPTHSENTFMGKYSKIDKTYNKIHAAQKAFNNKYSFMYVFERISDEIIKNDKANKKTSSFSHGFRIGKNSFSFYVLDKSNNKPIKADKVQVLLTRYESDSLDQDLGAKITHENGSYNIKDIEIKTPGRWKLIVRVQIKDDVGIFEQGTFAK